MGSTCKTRAGTEISKLKKPRFFLYNIKSTYSCQLKFTNMIQYTLMCIRQTFLREILDIFVNITDCCFLLGWYRMKWVASLVLTCSCFKAVLQLQIRLFKIPEKIYSQPHGLCFSDFTRQTCFHLSVYIQISISKYLINFLTIYFFKEIHNYIFL